MPFKIVRDAITKVKADAGYSFDEERDTEPSESCMLSADRAGGNYRFFLRKVW